MNLQKGQAGKVVFYPPSNYRFKPVSPMVRIGTPSTEMPVSGLETSVIVDPVSTTLSMKTNEHDNVLTFDSNPNFTVGRKYLLKTSEGKSQIIEPINTGISVTLKKELAFDADVGTNVEGIAIVADVSSMDTATSGKALINVYATLDDRVINWQQDFYIVDVVPNLSLTWSKLLQLEPMADELKPRISFQPHEVIDAAWQVDLMPDLKNKGIKLENIKSWYELESVHALCVIYRLTMSADSNNEERIRMAAIRYRSALKKAIENPDSWYSSPNTLAASSENRDFSTIRMSR